MATVLRWGDSEGEHGRCDAKCHEATTPACDCMCGGRFHGRALAPGGLEQAIKEFGEEVLGEARHRAAGEGLALEVDGLRGLLAATRQLSLFGGR